MEKSLFLKVKHLVVSFSLALALIYGFLPVLTESFDILHRMSLALDDNGIDPSRYYYTDVEQVLESERYLQTVLKP